MFKNLRRSRFVPSLPNRITALAVFFVGWGALHLLAASFNAGSSTPFYTEWFAVLGGVFVVSGVLLYRGHWIGVPVGLATLGIAFLSDLYQLVIYSTPLGTIAVLVGIKLVFAYALITIGRNQ